MGEMAEKKREGMFTHTTMVRVVSRYERTTELRCLVTSRPARLKNLIEISRQTTESPISHPLKIS